MKLKNLFFLTLWCLSFSTLNLAKFSFANTENNNLSCNFFFYDIKNLADEDKVLVKKLHEKYFWNEGELYSYRSDLHNFITSYGYLNFITVSFSFKKEVGEKILEILKNCNEPHTFDRISSDNNTYLGRLTASPRVAAQALLLLEEMPNENGIKDLWFNFSTEQYYVAMLKKKYGTEALQNTKIEPSTFKKIHYDLAHHMIQIHKNGENEENSGSLIDPFIRFQIALNAPKPKEIASKFPSNFDYIIWLKQKVPGIEPSFADEVVRVKNGKIYFKMYASGLSIAKLATNPILQKLAVEPLSLPAAQIWLPLHKRLLRKIFNP